MGGDRLAYGLAVLLAAASGCFNDVEPGGSSSDPSSTAGTSSGGAAESSTGLAGESTVGPSSISTWGTDETTDSSDPPGSSGSTITTDPLDSTGSTECISESDALQIAVWLHYPEIVEPTDEDIVLPVAPIPDEAGYIVHVCDQNIECLCMDQYGWVVTIDCGGEVQDDTLLAACPFG